ncbi:MAG: VWA domain-containing protein [Candidatus Aminicenantes bacterium]|nr:VWA domain-containing protein [Candidatus Aminicenantes bacterium]
MRALSAVVLIGLWPLFVAAAGPQDKKAELQHQISVSAIAISVTVQDKNGKYINDLAQEDFTVYENGARQVITYFKHDFEAPVSLTVLLDVSGSMDLRDKFKESKDMLRYLLTILLTPRDEVSLLIFADGEVEVAAPFSTDKERFLSELDKMEAYGQTALNDAVAVSPEFANRGKNEKRAILLITDGIENDSRLTSDETIEIARRVDVPIFAVGYKVPLSEQYLKEYKRSSSLTSAGIVSALERFSQATGGKIFLVNRPSELAAAFREIKNELSHQYIIGYTSYKSLKNEYRKIRVVVPKKNYRVRTREGY